MHKNVQVIMCLGRPHEEMKQVNSRRQSVYFAALQGSKRLESWCGDGR